MNTSVHIVGEVKRSAHQTALAFRNPCMNIDASVQLSSGTSQLQTTNVKSSTSALFELQGTKLTKYLYLGEIRSWYLLLLSYSVALLDIFSCLVPKEQRFITNPLTRALNCCSGWNYPKVTRSHFEANCEVFCFSWWGGSRYFKPILASQCAGISKPINRWLLELFHCDQRSNQCGPRFDRGHSYPSLSDPKKCTKKSDKNSECIIHSPKHNSYPSQSTFMLNLLFTYSSLLLV